MAEAFLHPYDVVCLTHCGVEYSDIEGAVPASSHRLLQWCPRTEAGRSGGVAVFVKRRIHHLFRVEVCRHEYGMAWFSYGVRGAQRAYFLCCYMPPTNSTYYSRPHCPDSDDHWNRLSVDVASYQLRGPVFICGDMNARTGHKNEWDLVDPHILRHSAYPQTLRPRNSMDLHTNGAGNNLLALTYQAQLLIMNGRAQGDEEGHWTYATASRRRMGEGTGCSVIDYWLVPLESFVRFGHDMHLQVIHAPPGRPDGGLFDHRPVECWVAWDMTRVPGGEGDPHPQPTHRLRWRDRFRMLYTDLAMTDGRVLSLKAAIGARGVSASRSCELMQTLIHTTATALHERVGGVFVGDSGGRGGSHSGGRGYRGHTPWVSQEVRDLQVEVDRRRGEGATEVELIPLVDQLKRLRKRDRKAHIRERASTIREDMLHNPRRFWRQYKGTRGGTGAFSTAAWSDHFRAIFQPDRRHWDSTEELENHCRAYPSVFGTPSATQIGSAAWLNGEVTKAEVADALRAIDLGKARGPDGVPAEFIRQAYHETRYVGADGHPRIVRDFVFADQLALTFSRMIQEGVYPDGWAEGLVTPVPKGKGDGSNMQDYRPITVGTAMGKVLSHVLLARLDRWAETGGWRADSQFGFRQGVGTSEAVFMMRHALDVSRDRHKPVWAAFVDFKQAYDSVDRELLWRCLGGMGVHGECLGILRQMYSKTTLTVRTQDGLGDPFEADTGVKQGDPLSPLLFGLFIDRVCSFLAQTVPNVGVQVGGRLLACILYADDLVLLAHDREGLQQLLDALAAFCQATRLMVNTNKTEVVLFHKHWHTGPITPVSYGGVHLHVATSFVYLGVVFHSKGPKDGARKSLQRRMDKARGALFAMIGTCHGMRVFDTSVLCHLFDMLCVPSLLYGVENWGPEVLLQSRQGVALCGEVERLQAVFLRMALWVRKSTPLHSMRSELGRVPLALEAVWRCAGFWNKMAEGVGGTWLHECWKESSTLGEGAWAAQMNRLWQSTTGTGGGTQLWEGDGHWDADASWAHMEEMEVAGTRRGVEECMEQALGGEDAGSWVRACPDSAREGFKAFKYHRWFEQDRQRGLVLHHIAEVGNIRTLAQFRCGSHSLDCELARAAGPRSTRTCRFCGSGEVEDELHMVLCERWRHFRDRFPRVFLWQAYIATVEAVRDGGDVDSCVWLFMNTMDPEQADHFTGYVKMVLKERKRLDAV